MSKRVALCIGVNRLRNALWNNLRYARDDAEDVAKILKDKKRGGFDQVKVLRDEEATRENILGVLREQFIKAQLTKDDLALIFFAGHGDVDKGAGLFLVPYDVEIFKNAPDITTTVHITDFIKLLNNTDIGTVVILIDACHSGGITRLLEHLEYRESLNLVLVGATRFSEKTWESPELEHGRFTSSFLQATNAKPIYGEWITLYQILGDINKEMHEQLHKQEIEVSGHIINQNIPLFRNPLFQFYDEAFTKQVKELCGWANEILRNPSPSFLYAFVMREKRVFERYGNTLVVCLDNSQVELLSQDIEQISLWFNHLYQKGQVTNGLFVTQNQLPTSLTKFLHPAIDVKTYNQMLSSLIDFEAYLRQIIYSFENSERYNIPPLSNYYVKPDGVILQNNRIHSKPYPIFQLTETWVADENSPICIVFGEYGMGKTAYAYKLAYELAKAYLSAPNKHGLRIPIIFPLYKFPKLSAIDMSGFITTYLTQGGQVKPFDYTVFHKMNKGGKFLFIFDGFDEMEVHAVSYIIERNFLEIIHMAGHDKAKLLITTRPELFLSKHEAEKIIGLLGNQETVKYLKLQPFAPEQIELYLQNRIPDEISLKQFHKDVKKIIGLEELITHPVLLEITIAVLPQLLESEKVESEKAVKRQDLYETYFEEEIRRKFVKRNFLLKDKDHRLVLMQEIGNYLYLNNFRGSIGITQEQLIEVLIPKFTNIQQNDLEPFVRDFIGCSFLVRDEDYYRFSHPSFMEFLVAKTMKEEIERNKPNIFIKFPLSKAVCAWLLDIKPELNELWCKNLWEWLSKADIIDNQLQNYMGGNALSVLHLLGESFDGVILKNKDLRGVQLSGATCVNADFEGSVLSNSNFANANLRQAKFSKALLNGVDLTDSLLEDTNFTQSDLTTTTLNGAKMYKTIFLGANLSETYFEYVYWEDKEINQREFSRLMVRNQTYFKDIRLSFRTIGFR